jgi:hypothetical protein
MDELFSSFYQEAPKSNAIADSIKIYENDAMEIENSSQFIENEALKFNQSVAVLRQVPQNQDKSFDDFQPDYEPDDDEDL